MTRLRVELSKTDEKRLSEIAIYRNKRLDLGLKYEWESDGLLRAFDVSGVRAKDLTKLDLLMLGSSRFIDNILNIANIVNIDDVTNLWNIWDIWDIHNIHKARLVQQDNLISNGDFETGDLSEWTYDPADPVAVTTSYAHSGIYGCDLYGAGGISSLISQSLIPLKTDDILFSLWKYGNVADTLIVFVGYTDGTSTIENLIALSAGWTSHLFTLVAGKYLSYINISHNDDTKHAYVDDVKITRKSITVSNLPALVASNVALGLGESATYDTIRVDTATSGQATLLAAQGAGVRIYVCGYQLQGKGDVEVSLRSASTDISPEWDLNAREGAIAVPVKKPLFYCKTVANELLSINLDAAIRVTGNIQYYTGA